jgi:isopentenyldiphosphate isomerase
MKKYILLSRLSDEPIKQSKKIDQSIFETNSIARNEYHFLMNSNEEILFARKSLCKGKYFTG